MNKILLSLVLLLNITLGFAQDWQTDFLKAKEIANKENKVLLMVFQGSDWCAPCMKLDREIWSSSEFTEYAKDHFVMLQVDFPRRKKNALSEAQELANSKLAETYNKNGFFPFVVIMNGKGDVLGETAYKKISPQKYIEEINSMLK